MNTTKEQRKAKAVELMKKLDIYTPYIKDFTNKDWVCFFEFFGGYWAFQLEGLQEKIKEIEERYNCTVYAVTHEILEFGECFSFLIVTDYPEEWDDLVCDCVGGHSVFAYVWNKTDEWCSEFGSVGIKSFGGGIKRVA